MHKPIFIVFLFIYALSINAQSVTPPQTEQNTNIEKDKNVLRPNNAITAAVGSAVANGDLSEAKFDLNFQIGYKRYLSPNFNIGISYSKFNIVFGDIYNEGFMSFDLDFEYVLFPYKEFSPYLYVGPGFNAANYFEASGFKFQTGVGLEYLVSDNLGLKLYADRSFLSDDILDGVEAGAGNDAYYKIGFGVNFYFPLNSKRKIKDGDPSFIKQNKLDDF